MVAKSLTRAPWIIYCWYTLWQAHTADVNCVSWHPTDPALLATCSDDASIRVWRLTRI